ncbi:MAG: hypothetical protein EXR73_05095 [Myxococcales bacterium]|nr:hypothetical protein [Myxococcales bacterium]
MSDERLKGERDELLMALIDRELAPEQELTMRAAIAADPVLARKAQALTQLSEVMRAHQQRELEEAQPALDAIWHRIERELQREAPRAVVSDAPGQRLRQAFAYWLTVYRGHLTTGLVAGVAAAAITAFAMSGRQTQVVPPAELAQPALPTLTPQLRLVGASGVDVEKTEFSNVEGSVYLQAPTTPGASPTSVIWIVRHATDCVPTTVPLTPTLPTNSNGEPI